MRIISINEGKLFIMKFWIKLKERYLFLLDDVMILIFDSAHKIKKGIRNSLKKVKKLNNLNN